MQTEELASTPSISCVADVPLLPAMDELGFGGPEDTTGWEVGVTRMGSENNPPELSVGGARRGFLAGGPRLDWAGPPSPAAFEEEDAPDFESSECRKDGFAPVGLEPEKWKDWKEMRCRL